MVTVMPQPMRVERPHRFLGFLAGILALMTVVAMLARQLPSDLQSLPYVPALVSATPWFALSALISLVLSLISRRWVIALMVLICLGIQLMWQYPFFHTTNSLPNEAMTAVSAETVNTDDAYARVMTMNVYKGHADAQEIVDLVRDQHVEVLALQETTDDFIQALDQAGIETYLPYSQVASSDGVYGNGLWSASALTDPVDDEVDSSATFMPGGTVSFNNGANAIRFVSVHTTSPKPGTWKAWNRSLNELARMQSQTDSRYVFMGDFNATTDHTAFRNFLGDRFTDAAQSAGKGFTFTWPEDTTYVPAFAGIDHVILDQGVTAGDMQVVKVARSDHAALLSTIFVG